MRMDPDDINRETLKSAAALRYAIASQLKIIPLDERRTIINGMIKNNNAQIGQYGPHKIEIRILGRTAVSTMLHVDWKPAVALENWIKATLEKDAPEKDA